jgi:hypothetical protein
VRSVVSVVAGGGTCCSVAMESSESTRGTSTEVGWSDIVGEVGS